MEKKITYASALKNVLNNAEIELAQDVREKLEQLLASLNKSKREAGKPTAQQIENLETANRLYEELDNNRAYTIGEMLKESAVIKAYNESHEKEMSSQKLASLLGLLIDDKKLVKTVEKRKTYYSKV